MKLTRS